MEIINSLSKDNTSNNTPEILTSRVLNKTLVLFASLCFSLSIVFFIAANWDNFSNFQKFGLLEGLLIISAILAFFCAKLRVALLVFTAFVIGGILALFAQIYSASNDPWLLFAIWALLVLPLALVGKNQLLWGIELLLLTTAYSLFLKKYFLYIENSLLIISILEWMGFFVIALLFYPHKYIKNWLGKSKQNTCFNIAIHLAMLFGFIGMIVIPLLYYIFNNEFAYFPFASIYLFVIGVLIGKFYLLKYQSVSVYITAILLCDLAILALITTTLISKNYYGDADNYFYIFLVSIALLYSNVKLFNIFIKKITIKKENAINYSQYFKLILLLIGASISTGLFITFLVTFVSYTLKFLDNSIFYVIGGIVTILGIIISRNKKSDFSALVGFIFSIAGLIMMIVLGTLGVFDAYDKIYGSFLVGNMIVLIFSGLTLVFSLFSKVRWHSYLYAFLAFFSLSTFYNGFENFDLLDFNFYKTQSQELSIALVICVLSILFIYILNNFNLSKKLKERFREKLSILQVSGIAGILSGLILFTGPTFLINISLLNNTTVVESFNLIQIFITNLHYIIHWICFTIILITFAITRKQVSIFRGSKFLLVVVIFLALSFLTPTIALAFTLLLISGAIKNNRLIYFALFTIIWILGAFYYSVSGFLVEKSIVLFAIAIILFIAYIIKNQNTSSKAEEIPKEPYFWGNNSILLVALLAISVISCLASVNLQIKTLEYLKHNGEKVLIKLIPINSRSLVQGDYMALQFQLDYVDFTLGKAYLDVDKDGVAHLYREAQNGEKYLQLNSVYNRRTEWKVPARAWFFKEGEAKKWKQAKYGILSVGDKGESILVGIADKNKQPIIQDKDK